MKGRRAFYWDVWLLAPCAFLLVLGLLMVTSSSMVVSDQRFGFPLYYGIKQACFILAGLGVAWVMTRVPLSRWEGMRTCILGVALLGLLVVLVPGIGHKVNGSRRWLSLGILAVQVSEFAKLAFIVYLAGYLDKHSQAVQSTVVGFIKPMMVLALVAVLLLLEPDFGALVVLTLTVLLMLFLAKVPLRFFLLLASVVGLAMIFAALASPYRVARLTSFLHPWAHPFGASYQLTQSLIAFGRGGMWGVGLGNSIQKLFYLPEAHTDFIFAVLVEELGMMGALLLLGLFFTWVLRALVLARRMAATHPFACYLAAGLACNVALQVMINIGVTAGALPTKGLALPFISYGGSSMLVHCGVVGLMLRIAHEQQRAAYAHRTQHGTRMMHWQRGLE
jgi:cell division protein FtsW